MTLILLCIWTSVLIFLGMVASKYYWTAAPSWSIVCFGSVGAMSTFPALLCNNFLSRETEVWIHSGSDFLQFMAFFIGAGLGEEFWKMGAGVIALILLNLLDHPVRKVDCVLGFVVVGLTFATIENYVGYAEQSTALLIVRGFSSVPLHATMGVVHGTAMNKARRSCSVLPLLAGYFLTVMCHTLYDTCDILVPTYPPSLMIGLILLVLFFACSRLWRNLPEIDDSALVLDRAPIENDLSK